LYAYLWPIVWNLPKKNNPKTLIETPGELQEERSGNQRASCSKTFKKTVERKASVVALYYQQ
jgi:hypothetical protein